MAETAVSSHPGSAASGLGSPGKHSRICSGGENPGSSGRSSAMKNDVRRWKRMHEQNAMLRLTELRSAKKVEVRASKENARELARKIPIELLVKDWLSQSEATIETRAYMVDKVMPTLILGVEKLLNAVDEKGLADPGRASGFDPDFNPLTFLAQYLFRNNPRFSNFSEASPYVRGMRQVAEELKAQLFDMEDNRLARIKAEAKRKRTERELQAKLKQQEKERRQQALMTQFEEWNVPTDNNRVELSLLQNALRSFMEVAEQFPPEIQEVAKFGHPLESTDETGRTLAVTEFAQFLSLHVETLPSEVFEEFMEHMSKCAAAHRASAEREHRRIMLTNLFIYCDHSGIGLLDRHRILNLFEQFWDVFQDSKKSFRNPRTWPVVEVDEADDNMTDDEDGVATIPETAREDEDDTTTSEPPNKSGVVIKISPGSSRVGSGDDDDSLLQATGVENAETGESQIDGELADKIRGAVVEEKSEGGVDDKSREAGDKEKVEEGKEKVVEDKKGDDAAGEKDGKTGEHDSAGEAKTAEQSPEKKEDEASKLEGEAEKKKTPEEDTAKKDSEDKTETSDAPAAVVSASLNLMAITEEEEEESSKESPKDTEKEASKGVAEEKAEKTPEKEEEDGQKSAAVLNTEAAPPAAETESVKKEKEVVAEEREKEKNETAAAIEKEDEAKPEEEERRNEAEARPQEDIDEGFSESKPDDDAVAPAEEAVVPEKQDKDTSTTPAAQEQGSDEASTAATEQQQQKVAESGNEEKATEGSEETPAQPQQNEGGEEQKAEQAEEQKPAEGDAVIQIEDSEENPTEETTETAEKKDSQETVMKEDISADPDLSRDVDITNEIAKSALQPQAPQLTAGATGRASITFAQGTNFERDKTGLTANSGGRSQSQMSAFDEDNLNVSQFVQLTETFLGDGPEDTGFSKLLSFLREGYEETEDEKMERLMKARKEAISANRKVQLDSLFEKWDNDGSGYLDLEEVEELMMKYKEGQEKEVITTARVELKKQSKYQDNRLSKKEFRTFVNMVIDSLPGTDGFEYFVDFLLNNVERSYAERVRGEARKKWLQNIMTAAETSGVSLDPIYKTVFQSLYRDAEAHGGEKRISANIALMERNVKAPHRGDILLRYTACTPEDAEYVLNKALYKDMNGISFAAVEQGKPIHVPRVNSHGNIHFWNTDRFPDEREGSFIVVPLKDRKRRVFGVMGVDTLADPHSKAIFITHEILYFQGVAQMFSTAYHLVDMRRKLLRITESAISWIKRRSPHVSEIMVYMVEPAKQGPDFVLRRMMTTDNKGFPIHAKDPPVRLERKDNLFRDYLFKSVDNSETVTADAYGNRQLAFPLRNDEGKAIAVVDISTGALKKLPPHENKEIQRMLRLLQQAHKEITREFAGEEKLQVLDAEKDDDTRMEIMFDRLMLMELRENVAKLDSKAYAELKAYNNPPEIVLHILRATLAIFYQDQAREGEFDDWSSVKTYINNDLSQKIQTYDPTALDDLISPSIIEDYLKDVPHGEVAKHGSLPAQHLYNWVFVCLSLIEHTRKMRQNSEEESMGASGTDNVPQKEPAKRSVCNPYGYSVAIPDEYLRKDVPIEHHVDVSSHD
ncbi:EF-hand calcium-binding domain-containing protein 5-like isoform X2 [Littorina saxatilis]|uniref:EF-hand calcium-binding domain-containing protein 5-like isoform X2 n=1 Tax=Littorina saxatilis TaxID=31220 RepID=UPI0038B54B7B